MSKKEVELVKLAKNGDMAAKEMIIENNINLIYSIVHEVAPIFNFPNMTFKNLIQEGVVGIIKAIEEFDLNENTLFSTYAYYHIKGCILKSIVLNTRFIRLPDNVFWRLKNILSTSNKLVKILGRKPTLDELARELNISVEDVKTYYDLNYAFVSFDELSEFVVDIDDRHLMNDFLRNEIERVFDKLKLSDREIDIIKLRFGFYDRVYGLREIGEKYNISHQRVGEIIDRVIEKIKLTKCAEKLVDYTDDSVYYMKKVHEYRKKNKRKMKALR